VIPVEQFGTQVYSPLEAETSSCLRAIETMQIATYNIDFSDDYPTLAEHIINNLGYPDVVALQNTLGVDLALLVAAIDAIEGPFTYDILQDEVNGPDLGILYNKWRIHVLSDYGIQTNVDEYFDGTEPQAALLEFSEVGKNFTVINVLFTDKTGSASITGVNQPINELQEFDGINTGFSARLKESNGVRELILGETDSANKIVTDPSSLIVLGYVETFIWH
jgi:hypothetical protein